jgi:hypothetical protein
LTLTADDVALLKACEGRILALELTGGEQIFAEIVMVVDEPPTPDVFLLRVLREPDGAFTATSENSGQSGESILLADLRRIALIPGIDYELPNSATP